MSVNQSDMQRLRSAVTASIRGHWVLFLVEGIVLILLGAAAILVPPVATLAVDLFVGWLFLVSGIAGLITTVMMRSAPGFGWSLFSAIIALAAGVVLLGWPVSGAFSLTLVLIVFFLLEGVASIMYALEHKRAFSGRWGWLVVSGFIDLFLGLYLLVGLPYTAAWAIGLIVGINLIFGGASLVAMALHARSAPSNPA
jgi:uncharacterized membrane protein HdeD (DUF308 family)